MTRLPFLAAALALAAPTLLQASEPGEGKRLAELGFASVDSSGRGYIDQGQFLGFGDDVFVSMDADEDDKLSLGEFLAWDYGMIPLAEERGRAEAYDTAIRVVFAFWDRNGNGQINRTEFRHALNADFQRADANNDALLSKEEFLIGFSVMVAIRAAINPAPVE